jgi:hypothetical protein
MQPADLQHLCLAVRPRWCGLQTMEATMKSYSLNDLFRLTRNELFALHAQILTELNSLPDDAPELLVALGNLALIRRVLSRRGPAP